MYDVGLILFSLPLHLNNFKELFFTTRDKSFVIYKDLNRKQQDVVMANGPFSFM